jgi:hypothetical protein
MALQPSVGPWPDFFQFLDLFTVGRTSTRNQAVARPLPAHRAAQTQNKRTQTSMRRVGFELTFSLSERAKTVHALDRSVTAIGKLLQHFLQIPHTDILRFSN